jgi:hypothetical protein
MRQARCASSVKIGFMRSASSSACLLRDGRRDRSRLILGHEIARVSKLRREVDIRHSETVGVANDVRDAAIFLDCPRRREAAGMVGE